MKVYEGTIYQIKDAIISAESSQDLEMMLVLETTLAILQDRVEKGVDIREVITV